MIDEVLIGALVEAIKLSPAVVVLVWLVYRMDQRAQQCIDRLLEHMDREH